eukprot:CAMPEP_0113889902 /NCGR_PEP_ID=MMETSP0780_2-20120614/13802_1 /TAXON_ID=652834 /ORGANISM="Palpitomonas bilix" /LENGTH=199 /DNA_ID=CAMNT_0000879147 /DNA_START=181 /DNA_END=777 /DNA_ORIENTATION=+ /assembly_acc=CAM_ASM_000599
MISSAVNLSLLLHLLDKITVFPAHLVRKATEHTVLPVGLKAVHPESIRDHHLLLCRISRRYTVAHGKSLKSSDTTGRLVGNHSSDGPPYNSRGSSEVKWSFGGVYIGTLAKEGEILQLVSEERSGHVSFLAPHEYHVLSVEELLGNNGRKAAKHVAFAVNNYGLFKHRENLSETTYPGSFFRNKLKYLSFLRKRTNVNP